MTAVGLLFPGQGAQAVGMGKAFYDRFPESREIYKRANARLRFDVAALCFEGPADDLTKTHLCQPALLVTSMAAFAAFSSISSSLRIIGGAGLSLGELTALTAAQAFTFTDALYLVQARAEAMAQCAAQHPGAMLAVIGLSNEQIAQICRQTGVIAANLNAPEQVVLSGSVAGIGQAEAAATAAGAKRAMRLDVSGAFHSPLMQPAAEAFRQAIEKTAIAVPRFPVLSNVTAQPVRRPEEIRELLVRQIVSPVLWEASMRRLAQDGAGMCVEFPPARVLTGLLRRIEPSVKCVPVDEPADFDKLTAHPSNSSSAVR